jgi:phytoene dehydrogenase-like protein
VIAMNDGFAEWLKCARVTDDPEGDLVADMRRDPDRPRTFTSLKALRGYIGFKSHDGTDQAAHCNTRFEPPQVAVME